MLDDLVATFGWGPDGPDAPFAGTLFWITATARILTCLMAVVVASPRLLLHIAGFATAQYHLTRFHQRRSDRLSG